MWTNLTDCKGKKPCARSGHRLVSVDKNLYMFGGGQWDDKTEQWHNKYNDVHVFDTVKKRWSRPHISGKAEVCTFPSILRVGYHILVFGGQSMTSNWTTNTLYLLDTGTTSTSRP